MTAEHKRPLYVFFLLALVSGLLVGQGLRTHPLGSLAPHADRLQIAPAPRFEGASKDPAQPAQGTGATAPVVPATAGEATTTSPRAGNDGGTATQPGRAATARGKSAASQGKAEGAQARKSSSRTAHRVATATSDLVTAGTTTTTTTTTSDSLSARPSSAAPSLQASAKADKPRGKDTTKQKATKPGKGGKSATARTRKER